MLGYSRLLWVRFYPRQDLRTLQHQARRPPGDWGGVPRHLLFDQMRSVLTRDDRLAGGGLLTNPECQRFAQHYGFRLRVCRPYRAQTKGKVERPIRYLRAASSTAAPSSATLISMHRSPTGSTPWPIRGCTAPPGWSRGALPGRGAGAAAAAAAAALCVAPAAPTRRAPRPLAVPQVVVEHREPRRLRGARGGWRHDPPRAHRPVTPRARPGAARRSQDARRPRGARRRAPAL
ncbi:MAG: transposase family protein [Gemmatimonadetes bacterium]|nr:transposase family protein [Gemmatimonadota bacterium]